MEIIVKENKEIKRVEIQELLKGVFGIAANAEEKTITLFSTSPMIDYINKLLMSHNSTKTLSIGGKEIYLVKGMYVELKKIDSNE